MPHCGSQAHGRAIAFACYAGIHAMAYGYHRMLSAKFPYAVYYKIAAGQIRVRAILDCRRDPKWIRTRLRN